MPPPPPQPPQLNISIPTTPSISTKAAELSGLESLQSRPSHSQRAPSDSAQNPLSQTLSLSQQSVLALAEEQRNVNLMQQGGAGAMLNTLM